MPFSPGRMSYRQPALALSRVVAAVALSIGIAVASAEERTQSFGPTTFHIPAQPLIDALQAYSRQSGVQVMFETVTGTGYESTAVEGVFAPDASTLRASSPAPASPRP
jgi:hypothetical protein